MKKVIFFTVVLCLVAGSASATDMAKRLGLGFNSSSTPIGGRYWFSPKVGLDFGLGISVDDDEGESLTNWAVSGGLPINILDVGDRVNFHFLPWVQYSSLDVQPSIADPDPSPDTYIDVIAALEFEAFVTSDLSVSATHGVGFTFYSPGAEGADSETDISTFGANITEFGVHYYLPGGGQ